MNMRYRQADWAEPLIFELSKTGRMGHMLPMLEPEIEGELPTEELVPESIFRVKTPGLPRGIRVTGV
jgi:hypothetical protein